MWEVLRDVGAIAGLISLFLTIWLGLRALGFLERPRYTLTSSYLPPHDEMGFGVMPHFVVEYSNAGNVPVTFSDFNLVMPRRLFDEEDTYIDNLGAELFIE